MIENANARLKNKFQKLSQSVDRACLVTGCSIILHNFIIEHDTHIDLAKARKRLLRPTIIAMIVKEKLVEHTISYAFLLSSRYLTSLQGVL